ncbi:MAG: hypothetical protein ACFB6R_17760 [Alphaproteobacteria bacterium]
MRAFFTKFLTVLGLAAGGAGPAIAANSSSESWATVTSVDLDLDRDAPYSLDRFDAPVSALRFSAVGGPVRCRRIVAVYTDGTRQLIFSGPIESSRFREASFDGQRRIDTIDMHCRAGAAGRARMRVEAQFLPVAAETGEGAFLSAQDQDRLRRERFSAYRGAEYYGDDFSRIGRVTFGPRLEREVEYTSFPGALSQIQLRARGSSIRCLRVIATFGNGQSRSVFQGIIRQGDSRRLSFGRDRRVERLTFVCQAERDERGALVVSGRYNRESARRGGGRRSGQVDWVRLGATRFGRRSEAEQIFTRFPGPVSRLGIRPLDDDARCSRIFITFGNGRTRDLRFGRGVLEEDRLYTVELPGDQRLVRRISLVCRAFGARDVTLAIYGIRIDDRGRSDGPYFEDGFAAGGNGRRQVDRIRVDRGIRQFGPGWTRVGRVTFRDRLEREVRYTDFPAAVSSVRFEAQGSSIRCRSVTARYANGRSSQIFAGVIAAGRSKIVSFRRDRRMTEMRFVCQSERGRQGRLLIAGKFDRDRVSAAPGRARGIRADWVRIGRATFPRRVEVTRSFNTFPGAFRRLALRPVNGDLRCRRILLVFQNGNKRDLPFSRAILEKDEIYAVDLPGNQRFIRSIGLACRALSGRDASIAILGIR